MSYLFGFRVRDEGNRGRRRSHWRHRALSAGSEEGERGDPLRDRHTYARRSCLERSALAEAAGAEYAILAGTETDYAFRGVEDGEVLHMGNTEVEVLHTPGETLAAGQTTPESAVNSWLSSNGHCGLIMDARGMAIGVGFADNHWTAKFGG